MAEQTFEEFVKEAKGSYPDAWLLIWPSDAVRFLPISVRACRDLSLKQHADKDDQASADP